MGGLLTKLRVISSNYRGNKRVLELIDNYINKMEKLEEKKILVNLFGLKIHQIETQKESYPLIAQLIQQMLIISKEINYDEGLAYAYAFVWYMERLKGNNATSIEAIAKAMQHISKVEKPDKYIYYFILYSYANQIWLESHSLEAVELLEECANYFKDSGFYRSLTQTLGILMLIYEKIQNYDRASDMASELMKNKKTFSFLPEDVKAFSYYFAALGQLYHFQLSKSENNFEKTLKILENSYHNNLYYYYYVNSFSHLSEIKALVGELDEALEIIAKTGKFMKDEHLSGNLDDFTLKQSSHRFNLTKFYVYTRVYGYKLTTLQDLIEQIYDGIKKFYSNRIMLSEFLLDAELSYNQLLELKKIDNISVKRVHHIIDFILEQTRPDNRYTSKERFENSINILLNRSTISDELLVEQAFVDCLIAQQLFKFNQYQAIYDLLRPYKEQLDLIEVAELKVYLNGLFQYADYKRGNPVAAAYQYVAIKHCRCQGFSRLGHFLAQNFEQIKKEALDG